MTWAEFYSPPRPFAGGWLLPAWRPLLYRPGEPWLTSVWLDAPDLGGDACDP